MFAWDWYTFFLFLGTLTFAFVCLRQYDLLKENASILFLVLGLLPCFCLFAFRHPDVGKDLETYAYGIVSAKYGAANIFLSSSGHLAFEPLSNLVRFVSYYLGGIQPFIFITTLIQFVFCFIFLKRLHVKGFNIAIFFLIFFSVIQLRCCSMVRNGIALSAAFCAYTYLWEESKNAKFYWLFSALAFAFHNSAIINIPIFFICKPVSGCGWEIYKNILLKCLSILFVLVLIYMMKNANIHFLITTLNDGKYAGYEVGKSFGIGNIVMRLPLLCLFLFYIKDMKRKFGNGAVACLYLMFFDLIISQTRYIYNDFERLTQYSAFGEMFLISVFYDFIRERVKFPFQIVYFLVFLIYFTYYMYRWAIVCEYGLMPFKFMDFSFDFF